MWLFLACGFFSCNRVTDLDGAPAGGLVQIRARLRAHLPALLRDYAAVFRQTIPRIPAIREDAGTDYRFRIAVPSACFARLVAAVAEEQLASNFKDSVAARWGTDDPYVELLRQVWHAGYSVQEIERSKARQHPKPGALSASDRRSL